MKPFHVFNHRGLFIVINVDDMTSASIDEPTAVALKRIEEDPGLPLEPNIREIVGALGLADEAAPRRRRKKKPEPVPITHMTLFVTQSCNLRCVYCYGDGGSYGGGGSMDRKTARAAVDWLIGQAGDERDLAISFFGGEPLLNLPLLKETVVYASEKGREAGRNVSFGVTTNGLLVDDEALAYMKEHQVRPLVSMDGPREIHDAQRVFPDGTGSFDAVVPRIKRILEAFPETVCRATLAGRTDPSVVMDTLRRLGFKQVVLTPASPSLFDRDRRGQDSVFRADGLLKMMEEESEEWLARIGGRDREPLKALAKTGLLRFAFVAMLNTARNRDPCGAGVGMVAVSCSGDIFLCHRFVGQAAYRLGSVFEEGLARDIYLESPVERIQECSACFARHHCAGGCKHANAGASGSAFVPDREMCRLERREVELAAYIIGRLDNTDRTFLVENEIVPRKPCPFDFP